MTTCSPNCVTHRTGLLRSRCPSPRRSRGKTTTTTGRLAPNGIVLSHSANWRSPSKHSRKDHTSWCRARFTPENTRRTASAADHETPCRHIGKLDRAENQTHYKRSPPSGSSEEPRMHRGSFKSANSRLTTATSEREEQGQNQGNVQSASRWSRFRERYGLLPE